MLKQYTLSRKGGGEGRKEKGWKRGPSICSLVHLFIPEKKQTLSQGEAKG